MEWFEAERIPEECKKCMEEDCYNCDVAGERWKLSRADNLRLRRLLMIRGVERLQRKIADIDAQLLEIEGN